MNWLEWVLVAAIVLMALLDWILESDERWYRQHPGAEEEFSKLDEELTEEEEQDRRRKAREESPSDSV